MKKRLLAILERLLIKRKRLVAVIVLLVIAGLIAWNRLGKKEAEPQLTTSKVEKGTIIASISASGQILVSNITDVTTQASGIVASVFVADGDYVTKGDRIAEIELDLNGQQAQAQAYSSYLSNNNSLESAKYTQYTLQADMFSKWDDFKELAESDSYDTAGERALPEFHISEKGWLAAEAKYKNQEAVISQSQVALNSAWLTYLESRSTITAPASGRLAGLTIAGGMQLNSELTSSGSRASQRVAAIYKEGKTLAVFNVSEIDVPSVEVGQKATVTIDAIADKTFSGKAVSVDRVGTVTSGVTNYSVIVELDTSSDLILPNMAATANIITDSKSDVLVIPSSALQSQAGQDVVRVLLDGREQVVEVQVGLTSDTQTEIVSGLSEGETVITGEVLAEQLQERGSSPFGGFGGPVRFGR